MRALLALGLVALAAAGAVAQMLDDSLAKLLRTTAEYQESLARLLALEQEAVARAEASAERYRGLYPQGMVSKREVELAEDALARAREHVEETRRRIAEAERPSVEARALLQLAVLPPALPGAERATPEFVEYHGVRGWTLSQVASLDRFFTSRFGRSLPVSALGQTPLHDRLGFDHRNALDVAVHPDSAEGRALMTWLRARGVSFLAFRGPVAGEATGAHLHVGEPSPRRAPARVGLFAAP
jgi:hypothetical protein